VEQSCSFEAIAGGKITMKDYMFGV